MFFINCFDRVDDKACFKGYHIGHEHVKSRIKNKILEKGSREVCMHSELEAVNIYQC